MESARRFRALLADLGLTYPDAAQLLHVSLRTLHNWAAGTHAVPYAVVKLLRMLRYMELPGKAWAGWHFTRGRLVTPEGRVIEAHESSWWSLLVQRARSFGTLYERQKALAQAQKPAYSEPCTSDSLLQPKAALSDIPHGNHGDNTTITGPSWGQSDTIASSWPSTSDSHPISIHLPGRTANGSESPSIRSSASHLTPIYNGPKSPQERPQPRYRLRLNPLPEALPLKGPPALPPSHGTSLCLPPSLGSAPSQSQSLAPSPRKPSGQSWPSGTAGIRPSRGQIGGAA